MPDRYKGIEAPIPIKSQPPFAEKSSAHNKQLGVVVVGAAVVVVVFSGSMMAQGVLVVVVTTAAVVVVVLVVVVVVVEVVVVVVVVGGAVLFRGGVRHGIHGDWQGMQSAQGACPQAQGTAQGIWKGYGVTAGHGASGASGTAHGMTSGTATAGTS